LGKKYLEGYRGVFKSEGETGVSFGIDYIHPLTGQRIRKILKNATNEAEAFEMRSVEILDAKRGAIKKFYGYKERAKPVLFNSMIDAYLEWSKENKKSWQTDYYRGVALKRGFDRKLLSDLNPFMIEKYKMWRVKTVTKSTVNKEIIFGGKVFEKAIEWGSYNGENPFQASTKFEIKKGKKPGSLTPDQVQAIIEEMKFSVTRDMIRFAFNTGWRISEIRGLKWEDVDLDNGLAWISDPKNNNPVEIELNNEAFETITRQKRKGDYVFCHLNGKPFTTNLTKGFKNAAERAGVSLPPRKAWHILRRTWASLMLQSGCDIETLRELGNWKDYSMPMWYADAGNRAHKKKMLNKIPKLNGATMAQMPKTPKVFALTGTNH